MTSKFSVRRNKFHHNSEEDPKYRRSTSLDSSDVSCESSEPIDIHCEQPWPEKCAFHQHGSLKAHFIHLSDTLATDEIPLTGFRSGSLDSQMVTSTPDKTDSSLAIVSDSDEGKENDSTKAVDIGNPQKDSNKTVWYITTDPVAIPTPDLVSQPVTDGALSSISASLADKPASPEKKPTRVKPKGTIPYEVAGRDSLESIAAHHDTTPSELKKLNRLVSRMIFPGQVLYIPDPDYVSSSDQEASSPEPSISPPSHSPPPESRVRIDVPLVCMADKPPARVPGHVERQISLPKEKEPVPQKLSEEEAKQLDQECYERFIKINVKHITDGQGVVSGTLIVTPNAVMFDPNVSDPLVIEHGTELYGMITPMDMVISAAMYHDIAAMRLRGKKGEDRATSPRPEVYHDKGCPLYQAFASLHDKSKDHVDTSTEAVLSDLSHPSRSSTLESLKSETNSICSCGVISRNQSVNIESPDLNGNEKLPGEGEAAPASIDTGRSGLEQAPASIDTGRSGLEQASAEAGTHLERGTEDTGKETEQELGSSLTGTDDTMGAVKSKISDALDEIERKCGKDLERNVGEKCDENFNDEGAAGAVTGLTAPENISEISSVETDVTEDEGFSDDANVTDDKGSRKITFVDRNASVLTTDASDLAQTSLSQDEPQLSLTLSGEEPKSVILNNAATGESTTDSEFERVDQENQNPNESRNESVFVDSCDETANVKEANLESDDRQQADTSASSAALESQVQDQTDGGFRPFQTSAKHLSNFVNYATGLFRKDSDDRFNLEDINEVVVTTASKTPVMSITTMAHSDLMNLEVESAIKLEDKPELFQTFDKLIARPATRSEDPPLYLCLRVGHPKNKEVSQTCPIESYRATKKKPEYWFSIPREKVDQLYAFFVQWTPEIYGDEDDIDPETRGFVVISDDDQLEKEEQLEIVDEHFASIQKIHKDWEIISKEEAIRRMSTVDIEDSLQLPEMVGESKLLSQEQLIELSQNMPARTIGYTWNLIYSTELHGFSLKTLYRDMCHVDSPILLVVADTSNNVFGAVTNCAFKLSDHFYGTGESFLYTFYPEFKVFHWTGENNFFIKGNKESLAIGAGQGQFGLWLDGDLYHGRSHRCETFDNDVLTDKEDFVLKGLEAWAFV
ncbi:oxidation resistance protein 1-like isoform X2 [Haliotis rubra]|uniref:oxidation resistance protein 1-like isoform X2 n=1 Tax=Haliotis rubra TaxID=36100 RepID=UPI001EE60D19|nr:oxidation resistance protein 1-like isoform X2 [Haliotis rubra]